MDDKYQIGNNAFGDDDFFDDQSNIGAPSDDTRLSFDDPEPIFSKNDDSSNLIEDYEESDSVPSFIQDSSTDFSSIDTKDLDFEDDLYSSDSNTSTSMDDVDYGYASEFERELFGDDYDPSDPYGEKSKSNITQTQEGENKNNSTNIENNTDQVFESIDTSSYEETPELFGNNYDPNFGINEYSQIENNTYNSLDSYSNSTYSENSSKSSSFLNWIVSIGAFLIIILLCGGLFFLISQSISGLNFNNIFGNNNALAVEIVNEIDEFYEIINQNESLENVDTTFSKSKREYWQSISSKGFQILDKIDALESSSFNLDSQIDYEHDATYRQFIDSSREYVELHTELSDILSYVEISTNIIIEDVLNRSDILTTSEKIDKLRAGIENSKGDLSKRLEYTEDLKSERIISHYYVTLDEFSKIHQRLKADVRFGSDAQKQATISLFASVYDLEDQKLAETKYFVDYSTQKSVKAVKGL